MLMSNSGEVSQAKILKDNSLECCAVPVLRFR